MKIYLINPKFPVTYWGFEYAHDLTGTQYTSPPLGLATVAALTPRNMTVEICDENIEDINFDTDADIIGLTAYLVQGPRAFEIAETFRQRGKKVVLGGPITSLDPAGCEGKADILFRGEAEYTWPKFIADVQAGSPHSEYVQTKLIDMRESPVPRFDLLKLDRYSKVSIQTTRGCPFNCEFCDIVVLFGRKVRCKAVSQVIEELREAAKYHAHSIFFTDDNFVGNPTYAKRLLRAMIDFHKAEHITFDYITQASVNLARDEELLELMYAAHITKVFVGIESPRVESLKESHKGQNLRGDLADEVKTIQSYNISVAAGMIVGFDHDDSSIFQEHFDFMMKSHVVWVMTGLLQAVPQTPLYERMKRDNRLDPTITTDCNNTSLKSNIIPKGMSKEELVSGYVWLLKQLYSYENYAKRSLDTLKDYARRPHKASWSWSWPKFSDLKIVMRTFRYYFLTLDQKRRKFSWEILRYVFFHKPYTFYTAMSQLVGFKHFHEYVYGQLERALDVRTRLAGTFSDAVNMYPDTLSQHVAAVYAEVKRQAAAFSRQASVMRDELQREAAEVSHYASATYEGVSRQASDFIAYAMEAYDELETQVTTVTAAKYAELAQQAALLSQRVATVNRHIAARYEELGQQAAAISQQAATIADELEHKMTFIPQNQEMSSD